MRRKSHKAVWLLGLVAVGAVLLLLFGSLSAQEPTAKEKTPEAKAKKVFTYTGAKKCKMCHSSAKSGAQYKIWEADRHAHAFGTLHTAQADSIAKAKGLKVAAAEAPECLKCHTTACGESAEVRGTLTQEEGVSCEACHGPGSGYLKMTTMKQLYAGEIEPASVGLVVPDEKLCKTCHNEESPTYKPFDFATFAAKIAHPVPKAEEEGKEAEE